jgi:hypothetical protein
MTAQYSTAQYSTRVQVLGTQFQTTTSLSSEDLSQVGPTKFGTPRALSLGPAPEAYSTGQYSTAQYHTAHNM